MEDTSILPYSFKQCYTKTMNNNRPIFNLGKDLFGNDRNTFVKNYREAISQQNEMNKRKLENDRRLAQTSIMSNANARGMLYSNFPAREKIKYDTSTYYPALVNQQLTYLTGLESLRNKVLSYMNNVRDIDDNIAHMNSLGGSTSGSGGTYK